MLVKLRDGNSRLPTNTAALVLALIPSSGGAFRGLVHSSRRCPHAWPGAARSPGFPDIEVGQLENMRYTEDVISWRKNHSQDIDAAEAVRNAHGDCKIIYTSSHENEAQTHHCSRCSTNTCATRAVRGGSRICGAPTQ
jgi:hypothetical protein